MQFGTSPQQYVFATFIIHCTNPACMDLFFFYGAISITFKSRAGHKLHKSAQQRLRCVPMPEGVQINKGLDRRTLIVIKFLYFVIGYRTASKQNYSGVSLHHFTAYNETLFFFLASYIEASEKKRKQNKSSTVFCTSATTLKV